MASYPSDVATEVSDVRGNLRQARQSTSYLEELVGQLEDIVSGVQPRPAQAITKENSANTPAPYPGLIQDTGSLQYDLGCLGNRLQQLVNRF